MSGRTRLPHNLNDTHFHVSALQIEVRTAARDFGGLVQRVRLDDENAANGILRFYEWAVDHLATADRQPATGLIEKLVRADVLAAVTQSLEPRHVTFEHHWR